MRVFDAVRQDARYAVRVLLQNPGFAAVAVLSLALGICPLNATLVDPMIALRYD